jgi:hypothetical protein
MGNKRQQTGAAHRNNIKQIKDRRTRKLTPRFSPPPQRGVVLRLDLPGVGAPLWARPTPPDGRLPRLLPGLLRSSTELAVRDGIVQLGGGDDVPA